MASTTKVSVSDLARRLTVTGKRLKEARATLRRFELFCGLIDTVEGPKMKLEGFQKLIFFAHFAGVPEVLVLIPKGNGKTTMLAALSIFHMLTEPNPRVFIGASTKDQAQTLYNEAVRIAKMRPGWRKRLKTTPGYKEIHSRAGPEQGLLKVLSSDKLDKGSLEGIAPTLGIVEELHAHVNNALYAAIHGGLPKRGGRLLGISTAGSAEGSTLGKIRKKAHEWTEKVKEGGLTLIISPDHEAVLFEWAVKSDSVADDVTEVKKANPASFITAKSLQGLKNSPSMTELRWLRYHCGLWVAAEGAWLDPVLWDLCATPERIAPSDTIVLGLDFARRFDHAALIAVRPDEAGEESKGTVEPVEIWKPEEQDGGKVPFWKVKQGVRDACEHFAVAAVGYDKLGGFQQSAEELEDEGIPMIEVSMKSHVWGPLTAELEGAIRGKRLQHNGDQGLRAHVIAGEAKESEHGPRLHGRVPGKVDALISMGIAWHVAFESDALASRESIYEERGLLQL